MNEKLRVQLDDIFEDIQSYTGEMLPEDKLFENVWEHINKHYIPISKVEEIVDKYTDDTFKTYDADGIALELIKLVDRTNKEKV